MQSREVGIEVLKLAQVLGSYEVALVGVPGRTFPRFHAFLLAYAFENKRTKEANVLSCRFIDCVSSEIIGKFACWDCFLVEANLQQYTSEFDDGPREK